MTCGAAVYGRKRALLLNVARNFRSFCSSSSLSDHECFIKEIAKAQPPKHLTELLNIFTARGKSIASPGAKKGLLPPTIPLVRMSPGSSIALLRWPTAPPSMEMPVVEVQKHGVWFLANNVDQFIHRILVKENVSKDEESSQKNFSAAGEAGMRLYNEALGLDGTDHDQIGEASRYVCSLSLEDISEHVVAYKNTNHSQFSLHIQVARSRKQEHVLTCICWLHH